jgi:hypothetical protein
MVFNLLLSVCICAWPIVQIDWQLLQQGSWEGTPYRLFEGNFRWGLEATKCPLL